MWVNVRSQSQQVRTVVAKYVSGRRVKFEKLWTVKFDYEPFCHACQLCQFRTSLYGSCWLVP